MLVSASRKIQNDIQALYSQSDRLIDPSHHYIVRVEYENPKIDATGISKHFTGGLDGLPTRPLVVYAHRNIAHLLFSAVDSESGESHQYGGSHHTVCSKYCSMATLDANSRAICSILEFDSRSKVIIYFQTKIQEAIDYAVISNSSGNITKKNVNQHTFAECVDILKKKAGVEWSKLTPHSRFGAAYKRVTTDAGEEKYSVLSEQVNLQDMDRYISYFFG